MLDRLMPIFAVIGVLSSLGYISLMVWVVYERLNSNKRKHITHSKQHLI